MNKKIILLIIIFIFLVSSVFGTYTISPTTWNKVVGYGDYLDITSELNSKMYRNSTITKATYAINNVDFIIEFNVTINSESNGGSQFVFGLTDSNNTFPSGNGLFLHYYGNNSGAGITGNIGIAKVVAGIDTSYINTGSKYITTYGIEYRVILSRIGSIGNLLLYSNGSLVSNQTMTGVTTGNYSMIILTKRADNGAPTSYNNITISMNNIYNNFTVNARDFNTNTLINKFNITLVNSTDSLFYETNNSFLETSLLKNSTSLYNISILSNGYLSDNYVNLNISNDLYVLLHNATNNAYFYDNDNIPLENKYISIQYPISGNNLTFLTDTQGHINWSTFYNGSEEFGNYNITFNQVDGYFSPQTFIENISYNNSPINVSYQIQQSKINITIKDIITNNLILQNTTVTIVGIGQFSTLNGSILIINNNITEGLYTAYAVSSGYAIGQLSFNYNAREFENIIFYLTNSTSENTGIISVNIFDEGFNNQLGVDVRLLQYFPEFNSFLEVTQCFSNSNGECIFQIQVGTTLYKITATKDDNGVLLYGTSSENGEVFYLSEYIIDIHLFSNIFYYSPDLLDFTINATNKDLINNISYLTGVWIDTSNISRQVCIRYNSLNNTIKTLLSGGINCAEGNSGEINVFGGYNLTTILQTNNVLVELFVNTSTGQEILYYTKLYVSEKSLQTQLGDLVPYLIMIFFASLIALTLYIKNIYIFGIGNIAGSILCIMFFPIYFTWQFGSIMIFLSFVLFYLSRVKEGNITV